MFPMHDDSIFTMTQQIGELPPASVIFGSTFPLQNVRDKVDKIADTNIPVLIEGESGVGKEVIARYLHQNSSWKSGTFLKVHCPVVPLTAVESELFGCTEAAFIGARADTDNGPVAQRGTLFLDEVAELSPTLQLRLVQVLQDGHFCSIRLTGGEHLQVRIVCATNRSLEDDVRAGRFRRDLYYRINGLTVRIPPLSKRTSDIPALADYFVAFYNRQYGRHVRAISPSLLRSLKAYAWPGNIRELENLVKRYVIFGSEDAIHGELATPVEPGSTERYGKEPLNLRKMTRQAARRFEHELITKVLDANHWNRKQAARALNISYRALLYKLKEAGITTR